MSLQVIFINEKNDKITFTKDELQTLLEDAYQKGYEDGSKYTITSPSPTLPKYWWENPPTWWSQGPTCVDKTVPTHIYTDDTTTGTPIPNYGTTISSADYPQTGTITAHWNGHEWACGVAPKVELNQSGETVVKSGSCSSTTK